MKPFEIFRPGTHTASSGATLAFADADLAAIAKGYDPKLHHAPIVVGHPKQDNPAYGWINSLSVVAGRLVATPADVDASFSELVKGGKFRKVSAAFYSPESANNPAPGNYYLRHVGFLGAAAPAVKGLKAIEFAGGDDGNVEVEIEFADTSSLLYRAAYGFESISRMMRRMRERMIAKEDIAAADEAMPDYEISSLADTAAELRTAASEADKSTYYSENKEPNPMTTAAQTAEATRLAEIVAREEALTAREIQFAENHASQLREQAEARALEDVAFVDTQIAAGRLPSGLKGLATAAFKGLGSEDVTFADGSDQKTMSPRLALRGLLTALPLPVLTGELAKGEEADFSDPEQVKNAIQTEMNAAFAAGKPISAAEAAGRITKGTKA